MRAVDAHVGFDVVARRAPAARQTAYVTPVRETAPAGRCVGGCVGNAVPMLRALALVLVIVPGCDLLNALNPPPVTGEGGRRPGGGGGGDDCEDDSDCDGGEFCDDGDCVEFGDEGEGDGAEGEGEPPPPPPPTCDGAGCPEILSLTSNRSTLTEFDSATLSAVVTDPDGVSDVIGGVLLDPVSGDTYGNFASASAGAFQMSVSWNVLNPVSPINFTTSTTRTLRARFFDQAGNDVFGDVVVTLACDDDDSACDGQCGSERCNGSCLTGEDFFSDDNCGGCGNACPVDGFCSSDFGGGSGSPQCVCDGIPCGASEGEGEPPVPNEPYSGTREDGVVCGAAGTCAEACCIDIFNSTSTCGDFGTCSFGGADCDGPEDCTGSQECCFSGFATTCVDVGTCRDSSGQEVCVNNNDCAFGELCCTTSTVALFGGDAGVCAAAVDGACPQQ